MVGCAFIDKTDLQSCLACEAWQKDRKYKILTSPYNLESALLAILYFQNLHLVIE